MYMLIGAIIKHVQDAERVVGESDQLWLENVEWAVRRGR